MPDHHTAAEPIIDAHHHIWRLAATPWLNGPAVPRIFGEYSSLRRDYLIEDYLADCRTSNVVGSVFVQVNVAPGGEIDEVAWVDSVAARSGMPQAITGFCDLAGPQAAAVLDRELAASPRLRAIRQQLHWHENPAYRFAPRPDAFEDPAWRRGLAAVHRRGLKFELQVFPGQMPAARRLVADFPDLTFILLHAGMLVDRSPAGWHAWREQMQALAGHDNVVVKLSGLGTFPRRCVVEDWQPLIGQTIELFGADRCMFGSNFPIERLWTDYATLVDVFRRCIAGFSADERRAVLANTARRVYAIADEAAANRAMLT